MKLNIFDITKYNESISKLVLRKAPNYVIEAYKQGFSKVVNEYYKLRLNKSKITINESTDLIKHLASTSKHSFIVEALSAKDISFLKMFYQLTNIDIFTGTKLPPDYSKMIKAGFSSADKTLKDVLDRIR